MRSGVLVIFVFLLFSANSFCQQNQIIQFSSSSQTLESVIVEIEDQSGYFFVYNPEQLPLNASFQLEQLRVSLNDLISKISDELQIEFQFDEESMRVVISRKSLITISGFIIDSLSSESLFGVDIIYGNEYLASSNDNGFFSVTLESSTEYFDIHKLFYGRQRYYIDAITGDEVIIRLKPKIDFNIVIHDKVKQYNDSYETIPVDAIQDHYGTSGVNDLIQAIKFGAGVSPGSEAQNGFTVRGGGPHQNLILIDGVPIYEASHLGGLSSIFLSKSIKNIDFYKASFNARYGGRASSVLDVRLKDGNRNRFSREVSAGLEGLSLHVDGPVSNNTSFNINARLSWFSNISSPIVKKYTDVTDMSLKYNDIYTKFSHWFSPTSKLSFSAYLGDDLVKIQRDQLPSTGTGFEDLNRISWGNKFMTLKWSKVLNKKLYLQMDLARSNYNYRSRGSYRLEYIENDSVKTNAFDILSISNITDNIMNIEMDYYPSNKGKYKFGIHTGINKNNPSITETAEFAQEGDEPVIIDTTYRFQELIFFVENEHAISNSLVLNSGLRFVNYFTKDKDYNYFEPRLSLKVLWDKNNLSFSYSRMSQFIHLLSNPGLGLPSDLWVPSTSKLKPELSDIFSIDHNYMVNDFSFGTSIWYKQFRNLIEYSNPADILYSLIIDNELYQVEVDNTNWEDRVTLGNGKAYGIEFSLHKSLEHWQFKANYSYSRSLREFNSIDGGESFPYKYDTPHSTGLLLKYIISDKASLSMNWQYSSGTAYSLSDAEQMSPDGPVLVPSSRNNFRLPDFHHLDIHYQRQTDLKEGVLKYSVGVYNVYNRLNAFYEYLAQDSNSGTPELVKISIYPILPQFYLSYSW